MNVLNVKWYCQKFLINNFLKIEILFFFFSVLSAGSDKQIYLGEFEG